MTNQTDQKRARLSRYRQPTKEEKFWTCSETNNFAGQTAATRSEPALSPTNCQMSTLRDRPQLREASQLCPQQIVGCPLCGTDRSYAKRASSVPNKLSGVKRRSSANTLLAHWHNVTNNQKIRLGPWYRATLRSRICSCLLYTSDAADE